MEPSVGRRVLNIFILRMAKHLHVKIPKRERINQIHLLVIKEILPSTETTNLELLYDVTISCAKTTDGSRECVLQWLTADPFFISSAYT
jgi:hypothetical protein